MALVHQFAIISKDSSEKIISSNMRYVEIPDDLMKHIGDSLEWIVSNWNGQELKNGISYYGFSIIENNEIEKLMNIISKWKELFELAPKEFYLTGDFLLDENRYEKRLFDKKEIVDIFNSWIILCRTAIEKKSRLLHNGI